MLTTLERQLVFQRALQQLRSEQSAAAQVAALMVIREACCPECRDRDSDPVYDGHGGIVCDLCGADWTPRSAVLAP